jgi:hypothetical protein
VLIKNDKLKVCVNFININPATLKNECHIPTANMLIDLAKSLVLAPPSLKSL